MSLAVGSAVLVVAAVADLVVDPDVFDAQAEHHLTPYILFEVARCCLVHFGASLFLRRWWPDKAARSILARSVMNVVFLGSFGWAGLRIWDKWDVWHVDLADLADALGAAEPRGVRASGARAFVPATPELRLYAHVPEFQKLAASMAAFQLKNLVDTVVYKDGALFFVHHLITIVAAVAALHPFAHFHGTFFMGVSETSTTLLAFLVNFDKVHGVPALEANYPKTRLAVGTLFAASFVLVRAIMWPFFSYFFIRDCLLVIDQGQAHDLVVVWLFVVMLAILSVMQVLWLGEIAVTIYREVVAPLFKADAKRR